MGFEGLLGNQRLKENLRTSVGRGHGSHFYLISGPAGSGKKTLARLLGAALLCKEHDRPCLQCNVCRKVMADTHPDFITVKDPEHKNIPVKMIREVREEMFILPNEADRKIYMIAQDLGIEGQNALLKILEEPPSYGVFMLLTDNPEKLLPTVRSRCVELTLQALPEEILKNALKKDFPQADEEAISAAIWRSGGYLGQAKLFLEEGNAVSPQTQGFVDAFAGSSALELVQMLCPMEKWKREQLIDTLQQWILLLQQALFCRNGLPAASQLARTLAAQRSSQDLNEAIRQLQKAVEYAYANVSVAAICGYLAWALR